MYFFNVKENRHGDLFLNIVEQKTVQDSAQAERHSIIVFEEDMAKFVAGFKKSLDAVKQQQDRGLDFGSPEE